MIVVQRVRVRWDSTGRGSVHANQRRHLPEAFMLPEQSIADEVVVHEVLLDQVSGYAPASRVGFGMQAVRTAGLWLENLSGKLVVDRLPGWQAYPLRRRQQRLFSLASGQVGRHRANFRFTGCQCNPSWYYEQWTTHITVVDRLQADLFTHRPPSCEVDDRIHLYGGLARRTVKRPVHT